METFRLRFLEPPTARLPSVLLEGSLVAADLHAAIQAALMDEAGFTGITSPVAWTNMPRSALSADFACQEPTMERFAAQYGAAISGFGKGPSADGPPSHTILSGIGPPPILALAPAETGSVHLTSAMRPDEVSP